jgi:serine/threonine-protein kinase RsbW
MINLGRSGFLKNNKDRAGAIIIKIPSEIKLLRNVSSEILESLAPYKMEDAALFDIRLCIEEAVRNAIVHGNNCDKNRDVEVSYVVEHDKLIIEVADQGKGFDHKHLPDPTVEDNITRNNGRGVYLIKRLMDIVEYNESGNRLKMVKYLK